MFWAFDGAVEYEPLYGKDGSQILSGFMQVRGVAGVSKVECYNTLNLGEGPDVGGMKFIVEAEGFSLDQQEAMFGSRENAVFFSIHGDKKKQKLYDASFHANGSALRGAFSNLNLIGEHSIRELKGTFLHMMKNYKRK